MRQLRRWKFLADGHGVVVRRLGLIMTDWVFGFHESGSCAFIIFPFLAFAYMSILPVEFELSRSVFSCEKPRVIFFSVGGFVCILAVLCMCIHDWRLSSLLFLYFQGCSFDGLFLYPSDED